jgi:RNA polymerase sigma factor (sigma-70 family)
MSGTSTSPTQVLLDRLREGDTSARKELLERMYNRLALLARRILHESFPRLEHLHSTHSVLNEGLMRLVAAWRDYQPEKVADMLRFAALQMRRWLLDQARCPRGRGREVPAADVGRVDSDSGSLPVEPIDSSDDPAVLAMWTEFHEEVDRLPEELRQVVDLCWYDGLSQQDAAAILGVSQPTVSRRLGRAALRLPDVPR